MILRARSEARNATAFATSSGSRTSAELTSSCDPRADVHNAAETLRTPEGDTGLRHQHRALDVDIHRRIPVGDGGVLERVARLCSGIAAKTSRRPNLSPISRASLPTDSRSVTSTCPGYGCRLALSPILSATRCAASKLRPASTTWKPSDANVRPIADPSPPAPPVTTATGISIICFGSPLAGSGVLAVVRSHRIRRAAWECPTTLSDGRPDLVSARSTGPRTSP